jgi:hypothetical protein
VERRHYTCRIQLDAADTFVVWYSTDGHDGFVRLSNERLLVTASSADLQARAAHLGLSLEPENVTDYDFDFVQDWCDIPVAEGVDCSAFLNAWNFFDDLAEIHAKPETHHARLSREAREVYDKLFWGNNLPAATPIGERYEPSWITSELEMMREVLESGLHLIKIEIRNFGVR